MLGTSDADMSKIHPVNSLPDSWFVLPVPCKNLELLVHARE